MGPHPSSWFGTVPPPVQGLSKPISTLRRERGRKRRRGQFHREGNPTGPTQDGLRGDQMDGLGGQKEKEKANSNMLSDMTVQRPKTSNVTLYFRITIKCFSPGPFKIKSVD